MKVKDFKAKLNEMTPLELREKLNQNKEELFNYRFQVATGHLDDYTKIRQVKKQIARINTVLKQKELHGASKS